MVSRRGRRLLAAITTALITATGGCASEDQPVTPRGLTGAQQSQVAARAKPAIPGRGTLTVYLTRPTPLYAAPGGARVATLATLTTFGSIRVLTVMSRRPGWLGVLATEGRANRVGWIRSSAGELYRTPYSIVVSVSRRRLTVRKLGRTLQTARVAVGAPGTETPTGHFAVTDKLLFDPGAPVGCCALALTGHQPKIAQGWGGGDRLAIHGTDRPASIGQAASHGCLRASRGVISRLVRLIPLGTRVTIVA